MGDRIALSPMYLHYYCTKLTGADFGGTTAWAGERVMKYKGICKEELWPNEENPTLTTEEIVKADEDAYSMRTAIYQRCLTIDDMKCAIQISPITLTFLVYDSFYDSYEDGHVPLLKTGDSWIGMHAVVIMGYDDNNNKIKFANSWGVHYGDKGFGYLPYEYINEYAIEMCVNLTLRFFRANLLNY